MPASGKPLRVAATKAELRRRIAAQRAELASAGTVLAAPLLFADRCAAAWRGLPPLVRIIASAAGSLATARLLRSPHGRIALGRLLPVLIGVLGRTPSSRG